MAVPILAVPLNPGQKILPRKREVKGSTGTNSNQPHFRLKALLATTSRMPTEPKLHDEPPCLPGYRKVPLRKVLYQLAGSAPGHTPKTSSKSQPDPLAMTNNMLTLELEELSAID